MTLLTPPPLTILCLTSALALAAAVPQPVRAAAGGGCVATVHPLATEAGLQALAAGGNAVDAAVAAALTLGVVDGFNSGIGGGCFLVIRLADGSLATIDGRETAPAAAHRDMYLRDGAVQPELSRSGPLAVAVPGALAAYDDALRRFGRLPLGDLLLPAAELAERGVVIGEHYARRIVSAREALARDPGCRALLLPEGEPLAADDLLRQPDLARTYRGVAEEGIDWFYRGPPAAAIGRWMAENGGILTAEDFAAYRPRRRAPVVGSYRGLEVVSMGPPSSGGVHLVQILNILEHFDLAALHARDPALFYHVVAEAMKLAFADRAHWLGDPDFVPVPRGLIDREYAAELAGRIRLDAVLAVDGHGQPPGADDEHFGRHTTHVAAADDEGNWVALTATINTGFGAKVIVPGTGVLLNNEMDDFSTAPGEPNVFGLLGAEANAIAPGKRPLSSMSPTVVLRDGRPILTLGAAGGPRIISQVALTILRHVDLQIDLAAAVAAPRLHHQWQPDRIALERGFDAAIRDRLIELGHEVTEHASGGVTQAIGRAPDGTWIGVHDPRVPGKAADRAPRAATR